MNNEHVSPKPSANIDSVLLRNLNELNRALEKAVEYGMITKTQHRKMNQSFIVMVTEWGKVADDLAKFSRSVKAKAEFYNGGRNMEADRHEDDGEI